MNNNGKFRRHLTLLRPADATRPAAVYLWESARSRRSKKLMMTIRIILALLIIMTVLAAEAYFNG